MRKKYIIAIIAFVAISLMAAVLMFQKPAKPVPVANDNFPVVQNPPIMQTGVSPELVIQSPQPAGERLAAKIVTLPVHGFVAVYESANGKPGQLVGASNVYLFPKTENSIIAAKIVKGKTYIAELIRDDGNSLFDPKKDQPLLVNGKPVTAIFKVQ